MTPTTDEVRKYWLTHWVTDAEPLPEEGEMWHWKLHARYAVGMLCDRLDAANQRIAELEAGLDEAIDSVESWGNYASEYFQQKHDLDGNIERLQDVLNNTLEADHAG